MAKKENTFLYPSLKISNHANYYTAKNHLRFIICMKYKHIQSTEVKIAVLKDMIKSLLYKNSFFCPFELTPDRLIHYHKKYHI